jgi:beta-mannosidase
LIDLAVDANMIIFRIWGWGIINKESFYEQCDEKGILVWEEFPLACNKYPDDAHYLSILKQEAKALLCDGAQLVLQ